jgi:hypothetical protein
MKPSTLIAILLLAAWTPAQAGNATYATSETARSITKDDVQFFTLPGCASCVRAKAFMAKKRIPYQEIDLSSPEGAKAAEALDVPLMAPMFAYKNRILRGFTPNKLEHFLHD